MSTPTNAAVVAASYPLPPAVQRYAKFVWGIVGFLLVVATTVVNNYANVMSQGWLSLVQTIIGVLSAVGVLVQQNALDPSTIISLVEKFLPNHTLVTKDAAAAPLVVPQPIPALPTPVLATPPLDSGSTVVSASPLNDPPAPTTVSTNV
jgi:hypothetical protein